MEWWKLGTWKLERRRTEARKDQQIERDEAEDVTYITRNSEWISLLEMQELTEINSFEEICKCINSNYFHCLGDQKQVGKVCKENRSSVRRQQLHG